MGRERMGSWRGRTQCFNVTGSTKDRIWQGFRTGFRFPFFESLLSTLCGSHINQLRVLCVVAIDADGFLS